MEYINQRAPYRSRRGLALGVCRGLAEYFGIPVFWMRLAALAALIFSGFWPVGLLYQAAALLMKTEPGPYAPEYRECWLDMHHRAAKACRRTADSLDARIRRLEENGRDDLREWDERLRNG